MRWETHLEDDPALSRFDRSNGCDLFGRNTHDVPNGGPQKGSQFRHLRPYAQGLGQAVCLLFAPTLV